MNNFGYMHRRGAAKALCEIFFALLWRKIAFL
jgi:hypothetical protein